MKIFISGSISIKTLPEQAKKKINEILQDNHEILVGDADGVDKLVRNYLAERNCHNITVYSTGKPRCDIPINWKHKEVSPQRGVRGREHFALKDKAMAQDCDAAFAIWDGRSQGTHDNIEKTKEMGKPTLTFNTTTNKFYGTVPQPPSSQPSRKIPENFENIENQNMYSTNIESDTPEI